MKKISVLLIALTISITSCKKEKKETENDATTKTVAVDKFVVKPEATSVKWTAYKTTEKKPVGGEFSVLNFEYFNGCFSLLNRARRAMEYVQIGAAGDTEYGPRRHLITPYIYIHIYIYKPG